MENLKLGDIVEYKVENKPYILAHRGSRLYSIIHIGTSNRFVAFSTSIGAHIQSIESSSIPACEYKLLKEIGDFLKRDVCVEDVCGDVKCLIGSPITQAEICNEATMSYDDDVCGFKHGGPYWSWTFYKFATAKGYVTIRWYGESNGCYSCEVMTEYTNPNDDILFKYELNPWGDDDES